ncbi:hypothetical protein STA1M1_31010 [Sinisalibacter aestuarii]|uniref:Uncharacterized protein n=2 Tax=Sinisalibacter aestuarii TaxID=2949426 RepID=A0ABQ5LW69_9RHOB|nr:hypothetical protein STA1M1_31010 [Sinisalibacter aestuarii]
MNEIFGGLGYDLNELELGIENQTDYVHPVTGDPTLNAIVTRRFPKDLAIFEKLYAKRTTRVFRGK